MSLGIFSTIGTAVTWIASGMRNGLPLSMDTKQRSGSAWQGKPLDGPFVADITRRRPAAFVTVVAIFFGALLLAPRFSYGALTEAQKQTVSKIRIELRRVGAQYKDGDFEPAGKTLQEAQESIIGLLQQIEAADRVRLRKVFRTIERSHGLLELEGVVLPPLPTFESVVASDGPDAAGFTKSVAPILIAKCGRCHVSDNKGDFSAASYAALMRGVPDAGIVIRPGDAQGSRLIEVIESGDMPRGGLVVTAAERKTLEAWIDAGAKYDGPDPTMGLARLDPNKTMPAGPPMEATPLLASGKESVSFSNDLALVLSRECLGCHGNLRSRNGLSFASFEELLKGGDSGAVINRKTPAESLLLTKLLGTGPGQRMPLNRPPLSSEVIEKFRVWLSEAATFDGRNMGIPLATVAGIYKSQNSTHEKLSAERVRLAQENWKLALPDSRPNQIETKHFLVVGSRGTKQLKQIGSWADEQAAIVRKFLKGPSGPFIKGRATLFVFDRRYDYAEFGKMVELRQVPKTARAHWRYSLIDAYGALLVDRNASEPTAEMAEQIASIFAANMGTDIPEWFATGVGRVVAAKMAPNDPVVAAWQAPVDVRKYKPVDILNRRVPNSVSGPVFFALGKQLLQNRRTFGRFTGQLRAGSSFAAAWQNVYGSTPVDSVTAFLK